MRITSLLLIKCAVLALVAIGRTSAIAQESPDVWVDAIRTPQYFAVYVEDVERSAEWYRAAFGLRSLGGSAADDGSWRIENLGNELLLVELIQDRRAKEVDRALGFRKVGFYVPDIEEVAERIAQSTGQRPRIVEFEQLNQRILQIRDPDGNVIQLLTSLARQK